MSPGAAADEVEALLENGFRAVKLRLGRGEISLDLAVRKRLPDQVRLMVDFNQALTFSDAMQYCLTLDEGGSTGSRSPSGTTTNFAGLAPMAAALEASASDYVMPDLDRIGGVTGWQRAAGLAPAYNREVSSHLFPEVSAHLLAATPGRHRLEYVGWAVPLLQEPLQIVDGLAIVPNRAGNGMRWGEAAVAKFKLD
jgi:mandelate racemase